MIFKAEKWKLTSFLNNLVHACIGPTLFDIQNLNKFNSPLLRSFFNNNFTKVKLCLAGGFFMNREILHGSGKKGVVAGGSLPYPATSLSACGTLRE